MHPCCGAETVASLEQTLQACRRVLLELEPLLDHIPTLAIATHLLCYYLHTFLKNTMISYLKMVLCVIRKPVTAVIERNLYTTIKGSFV